MSRDDMLWQALDGTLRHSVASPSDDDLWDSAGGHFKVCSSQVHISACAFEVSLHQGRVTPADF